MWTPSIVGKPRFFVSSRRYDILVSRRLQLSHTDPAPEPAELMQVPPSGLLSAPTAVSAMMPGGVVAGCSRMIGLKETFTSASANSCALRKSSSAG